MNLFVQLRLTAKHFKQQALTVYFVARDARTPILVKALALLIAAYALSPIDLIPDFIPILGYLDDLILIPLGLALIIRLAPIDVIASARVRAQATVVKPVSYLAATVIVALWLFVLSIFFT